VQAPIGVKLSTQIYFRGATMEGPKTPARHRGEQAGMGLWRVQFPSVGSGAAPRTFLTFYLQCRIFWCFLGVICLFLLGARKDTLAPVFFIVGWSPLAPGIDTSASCNYTVVIVEMSVRPSVLLSVTRCFADV